MVLNHLDEIPADRRAPYISHTQLEETVHKNDTIEETRDYRK
jgi:hypothetical protein